MAKINPMEGEESLFVVVGLLGLVGLLGVLL